MSRRLMLRAPRYLLYSALIFLAIMWAIPVASIVLSSLKSNPDITKKPFWSLPTEIHLWDNIVRTVEQTRMGSYAINGLIYATVASTASAFLASLAGFSIARLRPRGSRAIFYTFLLGIFFPVQMYLIPLLKMFLALGLYDTMHGLSLVYIAIAIPFAVFLMRNYFTTIPGDIHDAAKIDGLSDFMTFWKIFLPLAKPALAVVLIFQFIGIWNELLLGLVLTTSESTRPAMVGLTMIQSYYTYSFVEQATGALLVSIPTIVIFIFLNRYIVAGLTQGAIK